MKKYIIDEDRLVQLLAAEAEMCDLDNAGVDNWSFYGEHMDLDGYEDYEDWVIGVGSLDNFEEYIKGE